MLKKLLVIAALLPFAATAQTVSTFEGHTLPNNDTAYVNYTMPGHDVGFTDGLAYFPCVYDTGFGAQYWSYGFAYSNKHDSVHSGYTNQYAAKTDTGYGPSNKYVVSYGTRNDIRLLGTARGHSVKGFYVTNSTYAYNAMRDGAFPGRKFGDTTGTNAHLATQGSYPDFFKLTVRGYSGGVLKPDSVDFYLADYRSNNSASDYIVKTWEYVNLLSLGHVDSLQMSLTSSDNHPLYGMNTPAYYCMDNFTTNETDLAVTKPAQLAAKVYPNPATDILHIAATADLRDAVLMDAAGKTVLAATPDANGHVAMSLSAIPAGVYFLQLRAADGRIATTRIVKQ